MRAGFFVFTAGDFSGVAGDMGGDTTRWSAQVYGVYYGVKRFARILQESLQLCGAKGYEVLEKIGDTGAMVTAYPVGRYARNQTDFQQLQRVKRDALKNFN